MLTDSKIRASKPQDVPYKLTDAKGLHLHVAPSGTRTFRYRFELAGSESVYVIGEYCAAPPREDEEAAELRRSGGRFTLAEARIDRDRTRAQVKKGINPAAQRKLDAMVAADARAQTFEVVARDWVNQRAAVRGWEAATKARRLNMLERTAFPRIGALPMTEVTSAHVFDLLARVLRGNGPAVKEELQRSLKGIFALAISTGRADRDVVTPVVDGGQLPTHRSEHKSALKIEEVGKLLRQLADYRTGQYQVPGAFKLMWLTLVRPANACRAEWTHIDLDKALWTIPADIMKMRKPHLVPLPKQAVELLRAMRVLSPSGRYVFPGRDDRELAMSPESVRMVLYKLGWKGLYSPHATRVTGSTMLNSMGYPSDWVERQLAHVEQNRVRGIYNQADHLEERAGMMQTWADMLDTWQAGGKAMPIRLADRIAVAA